MNDDRLVEQARELRPAATGEAAYQFLSEAPGLLAGLADAVETLQENLVGCYEQLDSLKTETGFVQRRVWGPGDTYITVNGRQVREDQFRAGQKVERLVTPWQVVE